MHDSVLVTIPALTSHVSLLRAAGSALAARLDFTFDRITELQIAIDEACGRPLAVSGDPTPIGTDSPVKENAIAIRAPATAPPGRARALRSDALRVTRHARARHRPPA